MHTGCTPQVPHHTVQPSECLKLAPPMQQVQQQEPFGDDCTLRKLQLTCSKTGATHSVCHYQYHAWPDHGTPKSSSSIRALCRTLDAVRAPGHPVVAHCSAVSSIALWEAPLLPILSVWSAT
jgi:protein tyrosine phosphatase